MCSMAAVTPIRYTIPRRTSVATSYTNFVNSKTTTGRDSVVLAHMDPHHTPGSRMRDSWNPHALPFRPGHSDRQEQDFGAFDNQHPSSPPPHQGPQGTHGPSRAPWNTNFVQLPPPPPPPPPPMFNNPEVHEAYRQAQAYHDWIMYNVYGHPAPQPPNFHSDSNTFAGRPPHMQPNGLLPSGPPSYGPPQIMNQQQRSIFTDQAHSMHSQMNIPYGARNEDMPYVFDALFKALRSRNRNVNIRSAPTSPGQPSRYGLAASGYDQQKELSKNSEPLTPATEKKGRYGDKKIMLPAPQPTDEYMAQAAGEPFKNEASGPLLVILDLNGTLLFRPNRNAKTMIQRPFLKLFLRYLFDNFKVMVWSSAKPENVKSLVNQALDDNLRSKLVAQWARDSFGLSPTHYQQNVQVYKNLKLVWSRNQIQMHHPDYETGARFGQHNTVLIDDSVIKASAQPHNLLEIPEFSATPEQMQGDVLREVAGYLEVLRQQSDVSQFIRKHPFVEGGLWAFDWPDNAAEGGEMTAKVSATTPPSKKKEKKKAKKEKKEKEKARAAANEATAPLPQLSFPPTTYVPVMHDLTPAPFVASVKKDW